MLNGSRDVQGADGDCAPLPPGEALRTRRHFVRQKVSPVLPWVNILPSIESPRSRTSAHTPACYAHWLGLVECFSFVVPATIFAQHTLS